MTNFERIIFGAFGASIGILGANGQWVPAIVVAGVAIASAAHRARALNREDTSMTLTPGEPSPPAAPAASLSCCAQAEGLRIPYDPIASVLFEEARRRFLVEYYRRNPPADPANPVMPQVYITMSVPGMDFSFLLDIAGQFTPPDTIGDPPGGTYQRPAPGDTIRA